MSVSATGTIVDGAGVGASTTALPADAVSIAHLGGARIAVLTAANDIQFWNEEAGAWYTAKAAPNTTQLLAFPGTLRLAGVSTTAAGTVSAVSLIDPVAPTVEEFSFAELCKDGQPIIAAVPNTAGSFVVAFADGTLGSWTPQASNTIDTTFTPRVRARALWTDPARGIAAGVNGLGYVDGSANLQLFALSAAGGLLSAKPVDEAALAAFEKHPFFFGASANGVITNSRVAISLTSGENSNPIVSGASTVGGVDDCPVCFDTIAFGDGSGLSLDCGHCAHSDCMGSCTPLAEKYVAVGHRIGFAMARCLSGCGKLIRHPSFAASQRLADRYRLMIQDVAVRALVDYPGQKADEVIDGYLYYVCHRCGNPFWGGSKDCAAMMAGEPDVDPATLVCRSCSVASAVQEGLLTGCCSQGNCAPLTPGFETLVYLCQYCCNPATQFSLGKQWVCDRCVKANRKKPVWEEAPATEAPVTAAVACVGADECPFRGQHGSDRRRPLGCWACMSLTVDDSLFEPRRVVQPPAAEGSK